jgi:signal transduction histidine kinase
MDGLPGDILVDALWRDGDGGLWVGSRNRGLWHRSKGGWLSRGQGLPDAAVTALLRDRQGQLWVATRAGLYWHDQAAGVFRAFDLPSPVCGARIVSLAEDREGGLWLATDRCGLHRLQDRPLRVYAAADGLPADDILGLAALPDGTILAGTRGQGLLRWRDDPGAATTVGCAPELPCSRCWDFSPGPAAAAPTVWMVCSPNTVLGWDGHRIARVPPIAGLTRASFAIGARDGSAWMTVGKTVVRRGSDGVVTSLGAQEVLEGTRVLYQGRGGTVWIVARDGVAAWRNGEVRIVRLPDDQRPAIPSNVHEDDRGVLWIGTHGEGLRRLQGDRIKTVGVLAGLPTGWIVQPLEDDRGRMWMSSGRGIFWVETRQLDDVASGRRARLQVNLYDAADGVRMSHDAYGHPAGFEDASGRLLFATSGGVAVVQPAALGGPGPMATLEDIRLDGKRPSGAARAAAPAPADLEVTFGARSFARPETISFRYRLDGRDTDWVEGGAVRVARYAQLPAGDYRLLVEARTREGDWSAAPASLTFSVRPPFHRSPWFVVLCGLAAAMLLVLAHRLRLGRARAAMQATLQERSRLARDLHDTLAQAFVATSVQLDCLDQALRGERGPEARRHLDVARKLVSETLDDARRAVWVLRPQTLDRGLAAALSTLVRRLSGDVTVALDVMGAERTLSPLVASTVLRIAQEAVANARRHGQAGHIAVQLCYLPDLVTLAVSDDGRGLEGAAPAGDGTGIDGMKQRAAEIGATLHLESAPGKGTTIRLEVMA